MVGFQVISRWICSGLGWFSGNFQVTAPKEELAQWQERPMEIVSRYLFCICNILHGIQPRLIQSELNSGKRKDVAASEVKKQKAKPNFQKMRSQSTFEDD